jgi:aldehyde dehydrogenase (NAD+)
LNDGELVAAERRFEPIDPATGEVLGTASDAGPEHVEAAVAAARRAFDTTEWSRDHDLRVRCLRQLHATLVEHQEELRELTIAEVGAPRMATHGAHLDDPIGFADYYAGVLEGYEFRYDLPTTESHGQQHKRWVEKEAAGVVAAVIAYNYPNQLALAKLVPALAAGCTVVLKGAPDTPWTTLTLGKLIAEHTDIPPGVVNVIVSSGPRTGQLLTTHPDVDMITFTGSTPTGRAIMAASPRWSCWTTPTSPRSRWSPRS